MMSIPEYSCEVMLAGSVIGLGIPTSGSNREDLLASYVGVRDLLRSFLCNLNLSLAWVTICPNFSNGCRNLSFDTIQLSG